MEKEYGRVRYVLLKDNLRIVLDLCGLKQVDLAQKMGLSRQTVNDWLAGRSIPSSAQLVKICKVTGVNPFSIIGIREGGANNDSDNN